jgi:hypothetical protein
MYYKRSDMFVWQNTGLFNCIPSENITPSDVNGVLGLTDPKVEAFNNHVQYTESFDWCWLPAGSSKRAGGVQGRRGVNKQTFYFVSVS